MSNPHNSQPLVSVVIATRNRLTWLKKCLESVQSQRDISWELVVIDDSSDDGTRPWLRDLKCENLKVILPDEHLFRARAANLGLAAARGDYVMSLDDDDILHPGALSVLARALEKYPEAVASVGARRTWFTAEDYFRRDAHPRSVLLLNIFDELLYGWSAVSGQNLYRTGLIRNLGGYSDGLSPCDDRDLWLRVAAEGKVVLVPETVVTYRLHPNQWRPENLLAIREQVARKAIRALPRERRRSALRLRQSNAWIDTAEDAFSEGRYWDGTQATFRALGAAPGIYFSPLIGEWILRRLGGRIARRFIPAKKATPDDDLSS